MHLATHLRGRLAVHSHNSIALLLLTKMSTKLPQYIKLGEDLILVLLYSISPKGRFIISTMYMEVLHPLRFIY